jgi:hypothetical protein
MKKARAPKKVARAVREVYRAHREVHTYLESELVKWTELSEVSSDNLDKLNKERLVLRQALAAKFGELDRQRALETACESAVCAAEAVPLQTPAVADLASPGRCWSASTLCDPETALVEATSPLLDLIYLNPPLLHLPSSLFSEAPEWPM